ncbi:MAG: hypothetical protein CBR30_00995 [Dictyoglomus sp. NZ13-RE01]|nr:MAG: hypothetical protein CBR30_00995 [Dictyoglomus sp. NZ13-RE01]
MRQKVWGGLILIASSLSIALNTYTLLKQDEIIYKIEPIPAKPVSYIQDKTDKEKDSTLSSFVESEFVDIKSLKLGRANPFLPLVKEEISREEPKPTLKQEGVIYIEKREESKELPYYLRGILKSEKTLLAILESKNEDKSIVCGEGDRVGDYKIEKIDETKGMIIFRDKKGKIFNIKM